MLTWTMTNRFTRPYQAVLCQLLLAQPHQLVCSWLLTMDLDTPGTPWSWQCSQLHVLSQSQHHRTVKSIACS